MKYEPSAFIGRLSRSAGSTTAGHNRFGSYFRNRTIPTNPQTVKQMLVRASLAAGSAAWRGLTASQRLAWAAFGAGIQRTDSLGRVYTLTGEQAFLLTRRNLFTVGAAYITAPPLYTPPLVPTTFTVTSVGGALSAAFTPTPLGATEQLIVRATRPLSVGINFQPRAAYKTILVGGAATASPQVLTAGYAAVYGTPAVGNKILFQAYVIDNVKGLASGIIEASVVAA